MTKQREDQYDFYSDHVIVHSKSGNTYFINSKLECNCVGYGYRQECRHTQFVKERWLTNTTQQLDWKPNNVQQSILDQITKPREVS